MMNRFQRRLMQHEDTAKKVSNLLIRVIDKLDLKGLVELESYIYKKIIEKEGAK